MRKTIALLALTLLLPACAHHPHKPKPKPLPGPTITHTPIKPASIAIDPTTGWSAAPTAPHMPLFTNTPTLLEFFPLPMQGSLIIQRQGGATADPGYLDGKVTVPTQATLYVALRTALNDQPLITPTQLSDFAKEGWTHVPGIFGTSEPSTQTSQWQVWSHPLDPGPITLTSKSLPDAGPLFIGRARN